MTTEVRPARLLGWGALAVAGWLALAAAAAVTPLYTGPLIALSPATSLGALLASADARLIDGARGFVRVEGGDGAAVRLYQAGAWLVLPGRAGGCAAGQRAAIVLASGVRL